MWEQWLYDQQMHVLSGYDLSEVFSFAQELIPRQKELNTDQTAHGKRPLPRGPHTCCPSSHPSGLPSRLPGGGYLGLTVLFTVALVTLQAPPVVGRVSCLADAGPI